MIEESEIEVKTTMESEPTAEPKPCGLELSDAEAQAVIHAVEPIVQKCKKKKSDQT